MLRKIWDVKVTRFATVGVLNTALDLCILNTLVFLGHVPYIAANLVSASISMTCSYFLNHHIVFRSKEKHRFKKFAHFFVVTGIGILGIQSLVIYTITHLLKDDTASINNFLNSVGVSLSAKAFVLNLAKLIAVFIAMIWNFAIYNFVIFRTGTEKLDEDILL